MAKSIIVLLSRGLAQTEVACFNEEGEPISYDSADSCPFAAIMGGSWRVAFSIMSAFVAGELVTPAAFGIQVTKSLWQPQEFQVRRDDNHVFGSGRKEPVYR